MQTHGIVSDITERKRAEEALRASQSRYRLLFENNVAAIVRNTMDGCIVDCNGAAARILGYQSPQEMLGLSMIDIRWDSEKRAEIVARLQAGKTLAGVEMKFRHKDGRPIWLMVNLSLTPPDDTGEVFVQGTFVEITERKQAEEELYRSRQMLQSILDNIPQRVFWKDRNSLYLGCNRAFASDAGLRSPAEIVGKTDLDLGWNGTAEQYRIDDRLVMDQGAAKLNREGSRSKPDGSIAWLLTNRLPLRDAEGNVTGVLGTYEDITDRKRAEEALREGEAKLKDALLAAQMGVWEWAWATDTVTWNENLYRIAGRDPKLSAPSFEKLQQIFAPESWERLRAKVEEARATGIPYELDLEMVRPDGSRRWVTGRAGPALDARGHMTGLRGTVQDITERKQAEEALALFKHSIDAHYDGAYWADANNRFIYFNDAGCADLGYAREELIGKSILDISPEASRRA